MKSRMGQRGFTLLELMVVIFIMALALGLAGTTFSRSLPSSKLDATLREMMAAMKQARVQAVTTGERKALIINLDARRYGPEGKAPRSWPEEVTVEVNDPMEGTIVRGEYRIVFYPGGASEGGPILLSAGKKKAVLELDPVLGARISQPKE